MKTLVTGGTGFVGSHLVERLRARGDQVCCIAKDTMNIGVLTSLGVEVILGDLNHAMPWERILSDIDIVYHVAGVTRSTKPGDYYSGNLVATRQLLGQCLAHARCLRRFVYVSSLTAVGPSLDGRPVNEDERYHPVSDYGRSKMLAEIELLNVRDRLPLTIVRPSAVYGPREREWFDYIKLILRGVQPLIGARDKYMSMVHADDLVDGILKAAECREAVGKIYFLAHGEVCSVKEIGRAICAALRAHALCVRIPHWLAYCIGAAGEAVGKVTHQDVFFNIQKARESVQHSWVCSIERARRELSYNPSIGLYRGMAGTCAWYAEHGWL